MLRGKTALITGASSGIGKAVAERFAGAGADVIITARRQDRLRALAREIADTYRVEVSSLVLDVQRKEEVDDAMRQFEGSVDILVNNAGLALSIDKIQDGAVENWETMIDTNIKGLLYVTKALLGGMIAKNAGHIINIGSVAGRECYVGGNVYCATKFAVKALSKSLRLDLSGTGIRVSEIVPGAVETEFSRVRLRDEKKAENVYRGFHPLTAGDVADAVLYSATRPPHVNIEEIVIYPQAQASVGTIYRQ